MTRDELRIVISDPHALIATLYGEARNEPIDGLIAVANVIRNRVYADLGGDGKPDWWGESFRGVCLKRLQFSCWWEDNSNTRATYAVAEGLVTNQPIGDRNVLSELRWIAVGIIENHLRDNTKGADHYIARWLYDDVLSGKRSLSWAKKARPVAEIGAHVFFRLSQ